MSTLPEFPEESAPEWLQAEPTPNYYGPLRDDVEVLARRLLGTLGLLNQAQRAQIAAALRALAEQVEGHVD